eukprot:CAMPEP_0114548532 /NCGR_PEP_ID=MMETSP0114-20121206/5033_1 /TAXON_ID=31324 /ORGANISM="Goniomonas sp, Strain m" /LENGTH=169 /DNA_ID=CAMNT_0001733131 /DNA_START=58 /DNA_END=567 /DNA_ORIENTATION=-
MSEEPLGTDPAFKVKYKVTQIPGAGQGVVVMEPVKAGTLVWVDDFNYFYDSEEELRARMKEVGGDGVKYFLEHVYTWDGRICEIRGDGKLWNHSKTRQTTGGLDQLKRVGVEPIGDNISPGHSYALVDLKPGDELLEDYGGWGEEPEWYTKACKEYDVLTSNGVAEKYD